MTIAKTIFFLFMFISNESIHMINWYLNTNTARLNNNNLSFIKDHRFPILSELSLKRFCVAKLQTLRFLYKIAQLKII